MVYNHYITKKRTKIRGILGQDFNIPAQSMCDVGQDNIIYYKNKPVCYTSSQNRKDYFYGWADVNPEQEVERQKVAESLSKMIPDFTVERPKSFIAAWEEKGWAEEIGNGYIKWHWKDEVLDSSMDTLKYLIQCIKDNVAPFTLSRNVMKN